ncbi:uncharacterized protein LC1917_0760 [Lacticaseibacillus paracasei NRIC 1917]|uniref:Uncharacterized protein n=1 Tax=Lacticaseibacillus paracasei NRIC 0644 TaxID=1435038 RepID=A0A0C9QAF2_LACPA|nr:hypothetical protein [Lacticaseibacillus paracasei]GAN35658.1 uncharacterized protein LC0644_0247 [Lacticaseibacillus paracasei NRIC 0644]GAN38883.1 uncharacterized protein LC1917_0760 [Lacticaseibacillus paracasei NRIC 1917]
MKNGPYRFMSWLGLILIGVSSLIPDNHLVYGYYKTFVFLTLSAILFALWDIADVIREERE